MLGQESHDVQDQVQLYHNTQSYHTPLISGSAQDRKSSAATSVHSGGIDRKLSPPTYWYNGVVEDGHDNRSNYSRSRARRFDP